MQISEAQIVDNLRRVKEEISAAADRSHRPVEQVRLIAVSKTRPWQMVAAAIAAGQTDFGENTIQDGLTKTVHTADNPQICWHFIGHLQSNKTKYLPGNFHWLHTLDSLKLARRLEQACQAAGQRLDVLLQVNVANDPAKQGLSVIEIDPLLDQLVAEPLSALRLRGLMTIGAVDADESSRRQWFASLRELRDKLADRYSLKDFDQLSMGMSGDYLEAIEEGATMVRVGTQIFGHR